jgi:single-strand DNA-binding protein
MQKNHVTLAGYLATRPELRFLPSGTKVANVRMGETYRFVGQDGKPQTHTNWHSLVFYNEVAEVAMTYEQGENIWVEGTMQQRKFTPTDGSTRTVHEIHVKSCHIVAAARIEREPALAGDEFQLSGAEQGSGANHHDDQWPVGPA